MLTLALAKGHGPYGWGICSKYLIRELSKKTDVRVLNPDQGQERINGKVLHAIANILFDPVHPVSGDYNAGYCFFEMDLNDDSVRHAASYNHIFCGSTYNQKILEKYDIFHTSVLLQGVDHDIFNAVPPRKDDGKFVVFSGGKFEYRKGQDLVLAAFKKLMDKYPDMHLVTAWQNMWPESAATMAHSKHIALDLWGSSWEERMASLCKANGIPPDRATHYAAISQEDLSRVIENTDVGVFPNRCEGGTNLMLMEYMAKQRPVIASYNSGHIDVLDSGGTNGILLRAQELVKLTPYPDIPVTAHWWEPNLDELIHCIEYLHENRNQLKFYGQMAGFDMRHWTWERMADKVLRHMENPDLDRPDYLPQRYVFGDLLNRMGYTGEGAEIGVYRGAFAMFIYSRWDGKKLHLIDHWKHVNGIKDITNHPQEDQDKLYEHVKLLFSEHDDVNIIRADSVEAAKRFADGQLDWVHIDADHSEKGANGDLEAWFPKVRLGGLVAGHDYLDADNKNGHFRVKTVVDNFVARNGYQLKLSADERNTCRTWYFVKDH